MGKIISRILGNREAQILVIGLDGAGKTAIFDSLMEKDPVGSRKDKLGNVKVVHSANGQVKVDPSWKSPFSGIQAIIFVFDASDRGRIDGAKRELDKVLAAREVIHCPLLVLANKQDLPNAMDFDQITETFGLDQQANLKGRSWIVLPCNAITGLGLDDGLSWLAKNTL